MLYDIAFVGAYTKDTIVSAAGTRLVDGGAFQYGAYVAAAMGLSTAAVTRLAAEDWHVVHTLSALGIDVFAAATPLSTCLRLEYPTSNVDERTITVTGMAGSFEPQQLDGLQARSIVVGPSFRGEVGLDVLRALAATGATIAADVQGYVRVVRDGRLAYESWPEADEFLAYVDILKADAMEAAALTGEEDRYRAACRLTALGPKEIVLTHRDGLLVQAESRIYEAPFVPETLVGRSGRGDTCLAAYVAKRLSADPAECTIWAAALTSRKMEAEGPFRRPVHDVETLIRQEYQAFKT